MENTSEGTPMSWGWQIDNEIGNEGSHLCVCENCRNAFHRWLEKKYNGDVEEMNRVWGTVFWSTKYSEFTQVPVPKEQIWSIQNPGLILDYYRFLSDSAVGFSSSQVNILRERIEPDQWITHDIYQPSLHSVIDMADLVEPMEFAGFNNYPVWGDQDEPLPYYYLSYINSYVRGLKETGNYAVFEQICGFQGHFCLGYLPPEDEVVLWTNQAIAHGADMIFYFRWRTAPFGQEQLCYGILDPDGSNNSRLESLGRNIEENRETHTLIAESDIVKTACVIYDKDNLRVLRDQYLTKGLYMSPYGFVQAGYEIELARHFVPFTLYGINSDLKNPGNVNLSDYRIISLPMYQIADPIFAEKTRSLGQGGGGTSFWDGGPGPGPWKTTALTGNCRDFSRSSPGSGSNALSP